ncbi:MAG TPA: dihydropteroate synthase [Pirellulales bacterium]|jgi:dihydropteroate synthase
MNVEAPLVYPGQIPGRARAWQLKTRSLALPLRPLVMGIINVTPDSFSDGGRFAETKAAVDQALRLVAEGADLLDIGGESARPFADVVEARAELQRVLPVVQAVAEATRVPISIDTWKAAVAREAVAAGAEVINDITALTGDPAMIEVALETKAGLCAMHMRGTPQTMQLDPRYDDVVAEVFAYLRERRDALLVAGIERDRLALDPGIGFGKTHQHSLTLLAACRGLHELGQPVLVGHSRKGFIGKVIHDKEVDRTPGTIGVALALAQQGVQIIRVHDVGPVRQALMLFEASGGLDGRPGRIDD